MGALELGTFGVPTHSISQCCFISQFVMCAQSFVSIEYKKEKEISKDQIKFQEQRKSYLNPECIWGQDGARWPHPS